MTERKDPKISKTSEPVVIPDLERLDADLEIMERHEATLEAVEGEIQDDLRRRDREIKDAHLHSVPRPRKHLR
jgi:hypothetical protein